MNIQEREAVAQILALPDGPWEPFPGYRTTAEYAEQMRVFERHNDGAFGRASKPEMKRNGRPK